MMKKRDFAVIRVSRKTHGDIKNLAEERQIDMGDAVRAALDEGEILADKFARLYALAAEGNELLKQLDGRDARMQEALRQACEIAVLWQCVAVNVSTVDRNDLAALFNGIRDQLAAAEKSDFDFDGLVSEQMRTILGGLDTAAVRAALPPDRFLVELPEGVQ